MIVVYHKNNRIITIEFGEERLVFSSINISSILFEIAEIYSDQLIIWCHFDLKASLNLLNIDTIFHHNKIMASYNLAGNSFLSDAIGYIEESPFIKVNKGVSYPTWQMSSSVGGIHASVLLELGNKLHEDKNFDYFLHSLAKLAMPNGLLCYSEPGLINDFSNSLIEYQNSKFQLFRFVKQHYKMRWIFLLFLNLFLYERKMAFLPLVYSLFYRKRELNDTTLKMIKVQSTNKVVELGTIDVIIPTIGRKKYLYDVLKDLSFQTHLPENVIIVEQNPVLGSTSELDYLTNEKWPFKIKHIFTHQSGACNARNVALNEVSSEWVFLNDDDNRFDQSLLSKVLVNLKIFGIKSLSLSYLQLNEIKRNLIVYQSPIFGSGNSFIQSSLLSKIKFNMKFEFGYGEDSDFGMQLRNQGIDVVYFPNPEITHLKAPIGGFRTKPVLEWDNDEIQPKPSPTIMLKKQLHLTTKQIKGYKTILFFKFYKVQEVKNPIQYFLNFEKQWKQSLYWSNELNKKK
ncbi:glycosyltransferase family 2 protein [Flavobacterium sp. LAR06]|uniref:glycosyltransferase family 2 protein n=1 Tax=Flavobacterium sp. LAR06 TaxID=3064897 RepID=UPI0035C14552